MNDLNDTPEDIPRPTDLALSGADVAMPRAVAERAMCRLRWVRWGALRWLLPVVVAASLGVAIAGSHAPWEGNARGLALVGIAVAVTLIVTAGMMGTLVVAFAVMGASALAASEGRLPGFAAEHGWRCTLTEWAVAAGPLVALWWYSRREVLRFAPMTVAAVAAAGALAADAALHVLCPGKDLAPHVWLFHFGGFVAITLGAGLIARARLRREP